MKQELQSANGSVVYFPPPRYDATCTALLGRRCEFSIGELEQKLHLERQVNDHLADIDRAAP